MIFPKWPPSTDERLLLGRVVVNRDPCRTADPECKVPLGPSPQAPPGCSLATCRSSAHGSPFDRSHHLVASSAPSSTARLWTSSSWASGACRPRWVGVLLEVRPCLVCSDACAPCFAGACQTIEGEQGETVADAPAPDNGQSAERTLHRSRRSHRAAESGHDPDTQEAPPRPVQLGSSSTSPRADRGARGLEFRPARRKVADPLGRIEAMNEGASKPPGLVVLDAMIACAEAACEKYRLAAARGHLAPVTLRRRKAAQQRMEDTLTRLRAQRAAAANRGAVAH